MTNPVVPDATSLGVVKTAALSVSGVAELHVVSLLLALPDNARVIVQTSPTGSVTYWLAATEGVLSLCYASTLPGSLNPWGA